MTLHRITAFAARTSTTPGQWSRPLIRLIVLLVFPIGSMASELVQTSPIGELMNAQSSVRLDGDRLIYSRYDASGNNQEIVAIDTGNGSTSVLLPGRPEARFLTQDSRYLIYNERGQLTAPLVVVDKKKATTVGRIGLQTSVRWARIVGDDLIAIQYGGDALVLSLPGLKVKKIVPIKFGRNLDTSGDTSVAPWKDRIVALAGDSLAIFDQGWAQQGAIALPRPTTDRVSSCGPGPLAIYLDTAVVAFDCGDLLVIDLPSRSIKARIRGYSTSVSFVVVDGLILTVNADLSRQPHESRVFDLGTGRELATLPIRATKLYASSGSVIALDYRGPKTSTVEAVTLHVAKIRDGRSQRARLIAGCPRSALPPHGSDIYMFLDACEEAGISAFLNDAEDDRIRAPLLAYGLALARTINRAHEAVAILRRFKIDGSDSAVEAALSLAQWKVGAMTGSTGPLPSELETSDPTRAVIGWGRPRPPSQEVAINFGAFADQMYFSKDELLIGRYGAEGSATVSLAAYRRSDLQLITTLGIMGEDNTYQDNINSIAADEGSIYLAIDYRYTDEGKRERRTNFVVVDRTKFETSATHFVEGNLGRLVHDGKQLLSCDCSSGTTGICRELNPVLGKLGQEVGARCHGETTDSARLVAAQATDSPGSETWGTNGYTIKRVPRPGLYKELDLEFQPRSGTKPARTVRFERVGTVEAVPDQDSLLMMSQRRWAQRLFMYDISTGKQLTLTEFKEHRDARPIISTDRHFSYVGFGRDLMAFDLRDGRLLAYLRDFIGGFQDPAHWADRARIRRVIQDRGRLIVLNSDGSKSRVIDIASLTEAAAPAMRR